MNPYGKTAQTAVAAVSRLAEVYDPAERVKLNSSDIAGHRHLPQPVVAKVLTTLSQAGVVSGTPGPGGGYWLACHPADVTLYDVVSLFERVEGHVSCPFGPEYCGTGPHCPLHFTLLKLREQLQHFLKSNTFALFYTGQRPQPVEPSPEPPAQPDRSGKRPLDLVPKW